MTGVSITVEELVADLTTADRLLQLDAEILRLPQVECRLDHVFTPFLWERERHIPAGTLFTTYTWKIEHPYKLLLGSLLIWDNRQKEWIYHEAPSRGITQAGTKRVVYAVTDVLWITTHYNPTDTHDTDELEEIWLENYENPYLTAEESAKLLK